MIKVLDLTVCLCVLPLGSRHSIFHCVSRLNNVQVSEAFCDSSSRPTAQGEPCNLQPCPALWDMTLHSLTVISGLKKTSLDNNLLKPPKVKPIQRRCRKVALILWSTHIIKYSFMLQKSDFFLYNNKSSMNQSTCTQKKCATVITC